MDWLYPIRTGRTFLDVWTIVHVCFWVYFGSLTWSFQLNRWFSMGLCLALAFAWEVFERIMEPKKPEIWLTPESWLNAWVSDPLTCVVGVLFIWYALDNWRN